MLRMLRSFIFLVLVGVNSAYAAILVGNPGGSISIDEVYDYQCPVCHENFPILMNLIEQNPNLKVRLLPVGVLSQLSIEEAAAAIVSTTYDDKFNEFNNTAMTVILSQSDFQILLNQMGLETLSFITAMKSEQTAAQIQEGLAELSDYQQVGQKVGVPLFVVYPSGNKSKESTVVLYGYQSLSVLQRAVDQVSAKMRQQK